MAIEPKPAAIMDGVAGWVVSHAPCSRSVRLGTATTPDHNHASPCGTPAVIARRIDVAFGVGLIRSGAPARDARMKVNENGINGL